MGDENESSVMAGEIRVACCAACTRARGEGAKGLVTRGGGDSPVTLRQLCELAVAVLAKPLYSDAAEMAAWRRAAQAADAETVRRFNALSDPERRRVARGDEPVYTLAGGDRPAGWSAPTPAEALRRDLGIPHPSEPGDAPTLRQLINLKAAGWRALDGDNNPPELHAYLAALAAAPNELVAQIGQLPASTCWSIAQEAEGHPVWAAAERAVQKAGALRWQEPAAPDDLAAYVNDLSTVGDSPLRAVLPELVSVPIGVLKHPAPDPLAAALADPDAAAHAAIDAEERLHQAANRLRKSAAATASLLKPLSGEARARLLTEAICTYGADAIEDAMGEGVTLRREVAVEGGERACPCRGCALQREGRGR